MVGFLHFLKQSVEQSEGDSAVLQFSNNWLNNLGERQAIPWHEGLSGWSWGLLFHVFGAGDRVQRPFTCSAGLAVGRGGRVSDFYMEV